LVRVRVRVRSARVRVRSARGRVRSARGRVRSARGRHLAQPVALALRASVLEGGVHLVTG